MAGFFSRLSNIVSGKAHKALDKMEDPIEALENSIRKREDAYDRAARESATFIGSVNQKKRDIVEIEEKIKQYENGIRTALQNGDEDKATTFLNKKKELDVKLASAKADYERTKANADATKAKLDQLKKDIEMLKGKKQELASRAATAEATAKVNEILSGLNDDMGLSLEEIENKIEDKENLAEGLGSFVHKNPDDELAEYMSSTDSNASLKDELDKYR